MLQTITGHSTEYKQQTEGCDIGGTLETLENYRNDGSKVAFISAGTVSWVGCLDTGHCKRERTIAGYFQLGQ